MANPSRGLYERVLDEAFSDILQEHSEELTEERSQLDPGESHAVLAEHMKQLVSKALQQAPHKDRLHLQATLCNALLREIATHMPDAGASPLVEPPQRIEALQGRTIAEPTPPRPDTPLSEPCILTGTRHDPSLASQLKKEIASADQVDILCSFIKWTGLRLIYKELQDFTNQGGRLRVLTTTYTGATDPKAVARLNQLPHTEVRVSYDGRRTRLHAKAYLFYRNTGFSTAYVGSANLSSAALTEGLEWNVKISHYSNPSLWEKVTATFASYWNDSEFITCTTEEDMTHLHKALQREQGTAHTAPVLFNLRPYPFQQEILDRLQVERTLHGRTGNLVVAATGTGKTMVAAFDYQKYWKQRGCNAPPRLLYIAHRREILQQALETFRAVLREPNFGSLMTGTDTPLAADHLFCTIQSFNSRELARQLPPEHFAYLVIDETHHAPAHSYQQLFAWAQPQIALGLTATPERMDQQDVLAYFDNHISAEIRLPEAIERGLLSPFHYFGVTDEVDYRKLHWSRGGYQTAELDNLLTGNHRRLQLVLDKLYEELPSPEQCRGLGFCVSIEHARFMAEGFTKAGLPSMALSADSPKEEREEARKALKGRQVNFIFSVDLYNEGVDLPELDTVLFLRPTESLTIFLQQLGRGLRLAEGKECLTVLDFVGQAHRRFRFDRRFRELLPERTLPVKREVEEDFPYLPSGCFIHLERKAKGYILENITNAIGSNRAQLIRELRSYSKELGRTPTLAEFLQYFDMEPGDLYRKRGNRYQTLNELAAAAKEEADRGNAETFDKSLVRLSRSDSPRYLTLLRNVLMREEIQQLDPESATLLQMAHVNLVAPNRAPAAQTLRQLGSDRDVASEIIQLCELRLDALSAMPERAELPFPFPLEVHCSYTREEILAALGHWNDNGKLKSSREGVLYLKHLHCDIFFVTLNKTEEHYSPSTMYQDYALDERHFHWQSQSTTTLGSPTGRRYINQRTNGTTVLLFVRQDRKDPDGLAQPFVFLGPVDYVRHEGEQPISIVWRLRHAIPAAFLPKAQRLAL